MPRPSQKNHIMQAALACFSNLGYEATRVSHIARKAGVSDAALYRHFPSKEVLAQQLYLHYLTQESTNLQAIIDSEPDPEACVQTIILHQLANFRKQSEAFRFILIHMPTFFPKKQLEELILPFDVVEKVVVRGQKTGAFRKGHPRVLTALLFGCVLRPLIAFTLDSNCMPDLKNDEGQDQTICEAALAALRNPEKKENP